MGILREFDAIIYLRYGSWYLERIQVLEATHPSLYMHFCMGHFVVKDRAGAVFAAVAGDMKLEQSQSRFSQGPGGHLIVGSSGNAAIVVEFGLLFHEILAVTNVLQLLTNARLMDHLETTIQHELGGRSGLIFDKNVARLLDFVKAYQVFRDERYVLTSKKLSVTISKLNLPSFNSQISKERTNAQITKVSVSTKDIASAQRDIEIATMRGMSQEELYTHDILQLSPLFLSDITTQTDKAQLVTELETNLTQGDYQFNPDNPRTTHVFIDFMSKIRQFSTMLPTFTNFAGVIQGLLRSSYAICPSAKMTHFVFDSYIDFSIKEGR